MSVGQPAPTPDDTSAIQAITQVIHRCARALDRLDRDLLLSCFHADATDDHAPFYRGPAVGFVDWVLPALGGMLATRHAVSNILVSRSGHEAGVETYWSAMLRVRVHDISHVLHRHGRYLDRFTCRSGLWAIMHRQSVTEWSTTEGATESGLAPASIPRDKAGLSAVGFSRDRSDPSYAILQSADTASRGHHE